MRGSTRTAASAAPRLTSTPSITVATRCRAPSPSTRNGRGRHGGAARLGHRRHRSAGGLAPKTRSPDISASYSAHLRSDRRGGKAKPAPYNFIMGPSYSDGVRGDADVGGRGLGKAKGSPGAPKYVHMGDNHPYPNAPKTAGEAIAPNSASTSCRRSCSLTPGDYNAQCLTLKQSRRELRLSRQHRRLEHLVTQLVRDHRRRRAVPRQRLGLRRKPTRRPAPPPTAWCGRWAPRWPGPATCPASRPSRTSPRADDAGPHTAPCTTLVGVCTSFYMKEASNGPPRTAASPARTSRRGCTRRRTGCPRGEGICIRRPGPRRIIAALTQVDGLSHEGRPPADAAQRSRRRHHQHEGGEDDTTRAGPSGSAGDRSADAAGTSPSPRLPPRRGDPSAAACPLTADAANGSPATAAGG